MGLRSAIARRAVGGAHVLVVEVPGWTITRMEVERELARRGWVAATSPADADVLLICGSPGAEFVGVCDRLWAQLPGPRARLDVGRAGDVASVLDRAAAHLLDDLRQREDARVRPLTPAEDRDEHEHDGGGGEVDSHDPQVGAVEGDRSGMQHDMDRQHGGDMHDMDTQHDGDMRDMDMDMDMAPGGIPLAEGGPDRDGLEMDVLHVPLGPVLPEWPAGLVVDCVLQGDVIVSSEARVLERMPGTEPETAGDHGARAAVLWHCDSAARLLALVGWGRAAASARSIRDDLLGGGLLPDAARSLTGLERRVRRSSLLRWSLKDVRTSGGLVRTGLLDWLVDAVDVARGSEALNDDRSARQQALLAELPALIRGTDLGTARLVVAGLGIDTARLSASRRSEEHRHD